MRNSLSLYEYLSFRKFNVRRSTFALVFQVAAPFTFNLVSHEYMPLLRQGFDLACIYMWQSTCEFLELLNATTPQADIQSVGHSPLPASIGTRPVSSVTYMYYHPPPSKDPNIIAVRECH